MPLRLAGVVRESIVDGPGFRFVVFVQGCPHHCPSCHNPQSHDFAGGYDCDPQRILDEIDKNPLLSGVTFSGGEPFCQPEALCGLAREVKARGLGLMAYSGYTYEELLDLAKERPAVGELLELCDYLVDGRFVLAERDLTLQFRGSRNQRIVDLAATRREGEVVTTEL
ncbi:anaerobic ribonucleoside-triphosphate reductase activating protein [Clostridiaceae bacterium NSJ-31]|uniref:Anaerobic ribonucleoside-triphosphate reductase-activating protein n=1 Tax=Ligaoa zhengdingensis TaxID=2763658 RepID=A0A926DVR6_9FIRM|nr:anaerobic ribonucleoside-triphosphate reductase activating protein [Ligaoa zhengdingensis]MBC8546175.1 anaerobic ribonucleoside-triphosphate reductase activating protein [Ligaoa zhengdingensis]